MAAAANGDWAHAQNFAVSIVDTPGATSWPIVTPTFVLLPTDPKDPGKSAAVMKMFDWAYANGGPLATQQQLHPAARRRAGASARGLARQRPEGRRRRGAVQVAAGVAQIAVATPTGGRTMGRDRRSATTGRPATAGDRVFAGFRARAAGVFVLVLLGAIIVSLFIGGAAGVPCVRRRVPGQHRLGPGAGHVRRRRADLRHAGHLGAGAALAVPVAFGIAFFLTELAPHWMRRPVGTAIELLAAVPSIIYGMWGFFVIVPFMAAWVEPHVIDTLGRRAGAGRAVPGPAVRHRHLHRGADPGGDDHAVHRGHHARRVPDRAAGVQGERLRRRLHHLGGDALDRAFPTPAPRWWAASCWGWAARWARRWR